MVHKLFARIALAGMAVFSATAACAVESWPTRPITLIVPWAAGGSTDTLARILGQDLGERLNTTIIIENKPGAGGTIGSMHVARSTPNGYTFLLGVSGDQINAEFLYPELQYSPSKDLVPVGLVASEALIISARPDLPAKSTQDIITRSKEQQVTFGTSGVGSTGHLAGELLNRATGAQLQAVPYKGGAPAVTDTMAGHLDLVIVSPIAVDQQIKGGQLKPIATTAAQRLDTLPDVPTLKEGGVDLEINTFYMMVAPSGTPPAIIEQMNQALGATLDNPEVKEKVRNLGAEPQSSTTEELRSLMSDERARWGALIESAGLAVQK